MSRRRVDDYRVVEEMGRMLTLLEIVENDGSEVAFHSDINYGLIYRMMSERKWGE